MTRSVDVARPHEAEIDAELLGEVPHYELALVVRQLERNDEEPALVDPGARENLGESSCDHVAIVAVAAAAK